MSAPVLIAVDAGDLPLPAFDAITALVGAGEPHLLVVLPASEQTDPNFNWGTQDGDSREDHIKRVTKVQLDATQLAHAAIHVGFGDAATVIVDAATRLAAELIVIPCLEVGAHKSRAMNQPVADKVKATATCRVEVVPVGPAAPVTPPAAPPPA